MECIPDAGQSTFKWFQLQYFKKYVPFATGNVLSVRRQQVFHRSLNHLLGPRSYLWLFSVWEHLAKVTLGPLSWRDTSNNLAQGTNQTCRPSGNHLPRYLSSPSREICRHRGECHHSPFAADRWPQKQSPPVRPQGSHHVGGSTRRSQITAASCAVIAGANEWPHRSCAQGRQDCCASHWVEALTKRHIDRPASNKSYVESSLINNTAPVDSFASIFGAARRYWGGKVCVFHAGWLLWDQEGKDWVECKQMFLKHGKKIGFNSYWLLPHY